jgi:polysaccharide pyruvyl transferase WcaK-like protein
MKNSLNIEVRGIGFPNKGAELMLAALCDQIYSRYPNARICLEPLAAYHFRAQYPIFQLGKVIRKGMDIGKLIGLLPTKLRHLFGIIMPSEIDVIIDASGFAYGDQWGAQKAKKRLGDEIMPFKRKADSKVIMLPQAFGPFEDPALAAEMTKICQHADLVFARDSFSKDYLLGLGSFNNVSQAPDFTNLYKPSGRTEPNLGLYKVCLIPNAKMLEMKAGQDGKHYINFMAKLLRAAVDAELSPYLLVHEGQKDLALAEKIAKEAGCDVPVIQPKTAEEVKASIAFAQLVVSSRFHGLVSALSQQIPVIATGWSHKYKALLESYGMSEFLFDESAGAEDAVNAMLKLFSDAEHHQSIKTAVIEHGSEELTKTREMWQKVFSVLDDVKNG